MIKVLSACFLLISVACISYADTTTTDATVTYNEDGTISINMFISGVNPLQDAPEAAVSTTPAPEVVVLPSTPTESAATLSSASSASSASTASSAAVCSATGSTLEIAISAFSQQCPNIARSDCDPANGGWVCSSEQIGAGAPGLSVTNTAATSAGSVNTVTPSDVTPSTSLIAQFEDGSIFDQGLWAVTANGLRWTGPNRFNINQRQDDGNVLLQVTVPQAGDYRLITRGRIVSGIQSEPPNDMWVTFGSLDWTKAFIPQGTEGFSTNIVGEGRVLESPLPAGTTSITVSGRSTGFEIDYVGLELISDSTAAVTPVADTAVVAATSTANIPTPRPNFRDSYSAGGQCYCSTTFDHGIGTQTVNTPQGVRTVEQICAVIGDGPGIGSNPVYNDIQCGHGPSNGLSDEILCPGRIDQGVAGCSVLGPTWNLDQHFPSNG